MEAGNKPAKKAAKKGKKKGGEARDGPVSLDYDLGDLPSSQHRAGLAGLVLMIRWLDRQPGKRKGTCALTRLDEAGLTWQVDRAGLEELFDHVYGATEEEQAETKPRKDRNRNEVPPLRIEERVTEDAKGKQKNQKMYVYPVVVPRGAFLPGCDPAASGDQGPWVKLWRDMVWTILRGVPATRKPFEARAKGEPTEDAAVLWSSLSSGGDSSVELPSTYFLGAQAFTAEKVSFRDVAKMQILLHFWPFVAQVYVPAVIDPHKNQRNFVGYAIAIPDVADIETFCEEIPEALGKRDTKMSGYRPRESVIDLPAESALDVARLLADRLRQIEGDRSTADVVLGYDVFHMDKQGNSIRMLGRPRVEPDAVMVDRYRIITKSYWSPTFRKQRLSNLLEDRPWWAGFDQRFETLPHRTLTIGCKYFRHDAREAFKGEVNMGKQEKGERRPMESLIFDLVGRFVERKVESKIGYGWKKAKEAAGKQKEYGETKEKVARDAFLAARSRTGGDFADYFAGSVCSVPQYLDREDMVELSRALRERPDEIRTMTLLALSAKSWTPADRGESK